jgi:hypothetical protein
MAGERSESMKSAHSHAACTNGSSMTVVVISSAVFGVRGACPLGRRFSLWLFAVFAATGGPPAGVTVSSDPVRMDYDCRERRLAFSPSPLYLARVQTPNTIVAAPPGRCADDEL